MLSMPFAFCLMPHASCLTPHVSRLTDSFPEQSVPPMAGWDREPRPTFDQRPGGPGMECIGSLLCFPPFPERGTSPSAADLPNKELEHHVVTASVACNPLAGKKDRGGYYSRSHSVPFGDAGVFASQQTLCAGRDVAQRRGAAASRPTFPGPTGASPSSESGRHRRDITPTH